MSHNTERLRDLLQLASDTEVAAKLVDHLDPGVGEQAKQLRYRAHRMIDADLNRRGT